MSKYRVNYGNGQVSNTFKTKKEAFDHIANMTFWQNYCFVQAFSHEDGWAEICACDFSRKRRSK